MRKEIDEQGGVTWIIDDVDECYLEVGGDPEDWINCPVVLQMTTSEGEDIRIALDGLHLADIVSDAADGGLPVEIVGPRPPSHRGNGKG